MENKETKKKIQFGFLIALGCFLIQAIPFGVASNIHPQFLAYIIEEHGFSLASISGMFTVGTIISALFSPTIGNLFKKINAKIVFLGGAILSAGGVFVLSIAGDTLPLFYIGYGVSQIGTAAISSIGIPVLISSWFDESIKGKVSGIIFAGSGLGNIFLQQFSVKWIAEVGYQQAYARFALLSIIVGVVLALLIIRMPKDKSEVVGAKATDENTKIEASSEENKWGYSFAELKNIKAYWLFAIAFIFIGIYVSALASQYSAYLKSLQIYDVATLGTVGSIFALCSLIGNLMGGTLYDKLGATKTTIIGFILATTACLSLIFAPKIPALAYLYGATKGLSVFAYILAPSMLTGLLFGNKDFGGILGITQVFFALGFAFGSFLFGVIVDSLGYIIAWYVILGAIIIAYATLLMVIKSMTKLNKEKFGK